MVVVVVVVVGVGDDGDGVDYDDVGDGVGDGVGVVGGCRDATYAVVVYNDVGVGVREDDVCVY